MAYMTWRDPTSHTYLWAAIDLTGFYGSSRASVNRARVEQANQRSTDPDDLTITTHGAVDLVKDARHCISNTVREYGLASLVHRLTTLKLTYPA